MFSAAGLYFLVLIRTLAAKRTEEAGIEFPAYEVLHDEPRVPLLDRFKPWVIIMIAVIVMAYVPAFLNVFEFTGADAPPFSPDNPTPLELFEK